MRKVNTRFFYDYSTTAKEKREAILLHTGNGNRAIKMDLKMSGMPEPHSNREESQSSELPVGEKCTVGWNMELTLKCFFFSFSKEIST